MSATPRYAGFAVVLVLVAATLSVGGCGAALDPLGNGTPGAGSRTLGGSVPDGEKVVGSVLSGAPGNSAISPKPGSSQGGGTAVTTPGSSQGGAVSVRTEPGGGGSSGPYDIAMPAGCTAAAGATVTLGGPEGTSQTTCADSNGYFEFADTYQGTWPITFQSGTVQKSTYVTVSAKGLQLCQVIARLATTSGQGQQGGALQVAAAATTVPVGGTTTLTASYNGVHTSSADLIWVLKTVTGSMLIPTTDPGTITMQAGQSLGAVDAEVALGTERSNTVNLTICAQ
jgi:hypothetical protein